MQLLRSVNGFFSLREKIPVGEGFNEKRSTALRACLFFSRLFAQASLAHHANKKSPPLGGLRFSLAEREGFEPPEV